MNNKKDIEKIKEVLLSGGIIRNCYRYYKYNNGQIYYVDYDIAKSWEKYGTDNSIEHIGKYGVWDIINR